ncbi:type II toxin-antitoxin system VapC family toxin [uncultured Mucilaginibacter sp.]|uniref:type II toxin-antitoxin system VapC family toxin n=1 Tax=uncultured Mucilaginibacter sp. TaxID=797541 RepID=UPI002609D478|nr:type II toxin-antitoxin system VapC family toxin [uncultured Mucilaginibacter sp.]
MEQPQYLIDTNAVIDYLGRKMPEAGMAFLDQVLDTAPKVSVITKIEVLGFNAPAKDYQLLKNFMDDVALIELTAAIVERTIAIRKLYKTKLPDAIIAATALVHDLTLITRNTTDFKNITGIKLLDPYLLS